jgi:hypothetical protein
MIEVTENFKVNDNRNTNSYKNYSFTGFNKNGLLNNYNNFIMSNNLPKTIYMGLELLFSNQLDSMINKIIKIYAIDINIKNPKLIILLNHRIKDIEKIKIDNKKSDIELRNNSVIRNIIVELSSLVANSPKNTFEIPKIIDTHFNFNNIKDKIMGTDKVIIKKIFKNDDPRKLMLPINELINHINISINHYKKNKDVFKNMTVSNTCHAEPFFWCAWILEYDKRTKNVSCEQRRSEFYDDKHSSDVIWLLWEIINHFAISSNDKIIYRIIRNNYQLFCHKYNKNTKNERKGLLFNCILVIITPNIDFSASIFNDRSEILRGCLNTNLVSKKIMIDGKLFFESKKNELTGWSKPNESSVGFKKIDLAKINYSELNQIEHDLNNPKNHIIDFNKPKKTEVEKLTHNKTHVDNRLIPQKIEKYSHINEVNGKYDAINKLYVQPNMDINIPMVGSPHINIERDALNYRPNKVVVPPSDDDDVEKHIVINGSVSNSTKNKDFKKSIANARVPSTNNSMNINISNQNETSTALDCSDLLSDLKVDKSERVYKETPITNDVSHTKKNNIFDNLFIKQRDINSKTSCLGKTDDYIHDEKETSFSNSTHKLIFLYNDIYYPLIAKKYTSINKTFIPAIINELKDLFGIYKLSLTRFNLREKTKKYYYLGYLRKYPDKFIKMSDDIISGDTDLTNELFKIIAFRWIMGTNESSFKTIILENIMEDDGEDLGFDLYKFNNKFNKYKLFSYEENSVGGDNKINFNVKFMKFLKSKKNTLDKIFNSWNNNDDINKSNIRKIFVNNLPSDMDYDVELKVMYISYKLKNFSTIYNLFV